VQIIRWAEYPDFLEESLRIIFPYSFANLSIVSVDAVLVRHKDTNVVSCKIKIKKIINKKIKKYTR